MKLASWNINSLRLRLPLVLDWLEKNQPDALGLQEIKCQDKDFPLEALREAGWCSFFLGQKSYNGVAVLSKKEITPIAKALPAMRDDQARYLEIKLGDVRFITIYAPNGNPIGGEKFAYKMKWLKALYAYAQELLALEEKVVIAGDFNIIPTPDDVWDESKWLNDALYQEEVRALWRTFLWHGWSDGVAMKLGSDHLYTFWDYQKGAWQKDNGIRIDHFLLSPQAADALTDAGIDKEQRAGEQPSDHVPLWIELN